jgi:hypothetical protein
VRDVDRLNHVKIATPDPAAVDRFLREVVDIPAGWPLGDPPTPPAEPVPLRAGDADGNFTSESVMAYRGEGPFSGFITGSSESRQFQILQCDRPHVWGVAIGTRNLEQAHERCVERGIPCTEPTQRGWGDGTIEFFFAEVGGIVFEVMRIGQTG